MCPPGLQQVYRVVFHSRNVPNCYLKWRIPEFSNPEGNMGTHPEAPRRITLLQPLGHLVDAQYRQCKEVADVLAAQIQTADEEAARMRGEEAPR